MYFQSSSDFEGMKSYYQLISDYINNWEWMLGQNRPWQFNCAAALQHTFNATATSDVSFMTLTLSPESVPVSGFHFEFGGNPHIL